MPLHSRDVLGTPNDFRRRLLRWYDQCRRDLPWRVSPDAPPGTLPDPYLVLVSEAMLQQTQVATVIPYFRRFIERLPTLSHLAAAEEQDVLRLWQGLGYYSRARNLQATAKIVVEKLSGRLPRRVEDLLLLPGVGRYTAGAICSLAFDEPAPILDGNVTRVLCRIDQIEDDPRAPATRELLWRRAEEILPKRRAGDFNSALMELGATVCTARSPRCMFCPVQQHCAAFAAGVQERIPPAAKSKVRPVEKRWTFCVGRGDEWLIEQRPPKGRWAGMWQFITTTAGDAAPDAKAVAATTGVRVSEPTPIGAVSHGLTHRQYEFDVFACEAVTDVAATTDAPPRRWVRLDGLSEYPLPRPHLRIATLLAELRSPSVRVR
jgi:A/G-specific adenine glycosylase